MVGFTYSDVLALPVYERRFFLSLKARDVNKQKEYQDKIQPLFIKLQGNAATQMPEGFVRPGPPPDTPPPDVPPSGAASTSEKSMDEVD